MILPITLSTAAACTVVNLWLAIRAARLRRGPELLIGDGGDMPLRAAMRAHANFTEYAPFVLILMAGVELAGGSATGLWVAGAVFVVARVLHPFGMGEGRPIALRAVGMAGTALVLIALAGWAATLAYRG